MMLRWSEKLEVEMARRNQKPESGTVMNMIGKNIV